MNTRIFIFFVVLATLLLSGCAVSPKTPPPPPPDPLLSDPAVIRVECKSAHRTGCRAKGRIFPWGAWLDFMGYDSRDYELLKVIQKGPRATVLIKPR